MILLNGDLQWDQIDTEYPYNIQCRFLTLLPAFFLTLGLLAFIAAVVGVPQIIVAMQRKDLSSQDEKNRISTETDRDFAAGDRNA